MVMAMSRVELQDGSLWERRGAWWRGTWSRVQATAQEQVPARKSLQERITGGVKEEQQGDAHQILASSS